ncbi:MAG: rod shape-determining protein MreC [Planctomycetes bacterium]|nr:rod shape-determining protein MreC [Planctomycetota bacterium]
METRKLCAGLLAATIAAGLLLSDALSHVLRGVLTDAVSPASSRLRRVRMGLFDHPPAREEGDDATDLSWAYAQAISRLAQKEIEVRVLSEQLRGLGALAANPQAAARPLRPARIAGRGLGTWSGTVDLDVGERDGIRKGMVVVSGYHLLGRIDEVYAGRCRVRLTTDPAFRAMCVIASVASDTTVLGAATRPQQDVLLHGVARGTGRTHGRCRIDLIPVDQPVLPGDRVLTTGDDNLFPPGLEIGQVVSTQPSTLFHEIEMLPSARVSGLETVQVLDWTAP